MSQFINTKETLVTDAIEGLLATSNGTLTRLDGFPHIRVVVRADWDRSKVALISGGGSGHEPSHAGFVGHGMLTAAVCGDVFASPSVDAVLAAILAVTGAKGCLLIVKSYTGDRLNFGLAAEKARALGYNVNLVIVDDDVALPDLPQARGLAGTLFVHKIAGALAEQGADLETITKSAQKIISNTRTIGISLGTCTVPGSLKENRIPEGHAELGMGIHGEPGVEQIEQRSAKKTLALMVDKLAGGQNRRNYVALINNLGATSELEMAVITKELINSSIGDQITHVIGPSPLMTSLDMHGFSVSLLDAEESDVSLLSDAAPNTAWPGIKLVKKSALLPLPKELNPIGFKATHNDAHRALVIKCCEVLTSAEQRLNQLDAKSGDGDTGSTLSAAAEALKQNIDRLPLADQTQLLRAIGHELSQTMGGSSGVLLAIFFSAAADASSNGADFVSSLQAGLSRMQEIGGANLGDRTMVDALHPALQALHRGISEAAKAAREGAEHTATIVTAKAGRASYVNAQNLKGHKDPGAEAVALLFEYLAAK